MKLLFSLLLIFCFISSTLGESVVTLTDETFDDFVTSHEKVLAEFYAPWCGHCKALAPEYEKAAEAIAADEKMDVVLVKIDATENKKLGDRYKVEGFPTLIYFTGSPDTHTPYTGGRTSDTIVSWLRKRSLPAISKLTTQEEYSSFVEGSKNGIVLVGFVEENSEDEKVLKKLSEKYLEKLTTGHFVDSSLRKTVLKDDNDEDTKLILHRNFDESFVKYSGDFTEESVSQFIESERFPLIDQIGPENYRDYVDRKLPIVWIALDPDNTEQKETILDNLKNHASNTKGKLSFTWVNGIQYKQHIENLGIQKVPGLIIVNSENNEKYIYQGDLENTEQLDTFWNEYSSGSLEAYLKSEEIPETNDDPVYVLVGKSFNDVIGHKRDVFVEFYAPWCGHCKRLAPEYEKVGLAFADDDNVVVAKIDATQNDTPEQIGGFPTLIFYPSGSNQGVKYEGARTSEDIIEYLKAQKTTTSDDHEDDTQEKDESEKQDL